MTLKDFAQMMKTISQIQPNGAPDFKNEAVVTFWFNELKTIPDAKLQKAFSVLIRDRFFPCLNDVLKATGEFDNRIIKEMAERLESAEEKKNEQPKYIGGVEVRLLSAD